MPESSRDEIAKLEALYANNPEGRVFTHLAEAYRKAGELDRARKILEEGLQKHATYASAHVVLGRVLMDQQNAEEAAESFRRVLSLDPHNMVALRSLGDIARAAGRNAEALGYYEELKHHDQNNEEVAGIIAELSMSPAPRPPEPTSQHSAPPAPDLAPRPVRMETDTAVPAADPPPQPVLQVPPPDEMDLGWAPVATGDSDADFTLPGDLGALANMSLGAPEPEAESETHDVPTFPVADSAEFGSVDIDQPMAEPPAPEEPAFLSFADSPAAQTPADVTPQQETGEVVTETIAELYTSQGLHERAAEVYRALLEQRPGDAVLETKLAEAEKAASGETAGSAPATEASGSWETAFAMSADGTDEPEADDAEAWLAGAPHPGTSAPTPYAWTESPEPSAQEDGGPLISDYFRTLLAWRPSRTEAVEAAPPFAADLQPEPMAVAPVEVQDEADLLFLDEPVTDEAVMVEEFAPPPPPESPVVPVATPVAADDLMPWEDAVPAQLEPASPQPSAPQPSAPQPSAPQPSAPQSPSPATPSTSTDPGDVFDEWFGAPDEPAGAPAPPAPPAPESDSQPGDEDDDDLEMFRSWLQSLKK